MLSTRAPADEPNCSCGSGRVFGCIASEPQVHLTSYHIHTPSIARMQTNFPPATRLHRILKPNGALVASLHDVGYWGDGFHARGACRWVDTTRECSSSTTAPPLTKAEARRPTFPSGGYASTGAARLISSASSQQASDWTIGAPGRRGLLREAAPSLDPHLADLESPSSDVRETSAASRGRQLAYEEPKHMTDCLRSLNARLTQADAARDHRPYDIRP